MDHEHKTDPRYRISVEGILDPAWNEWFNGLNITTEQGHIPTTTLSGPISDQAALRGILNKLWDLNLTLIAVVREK